jgi:predicted metal-dependent peptidase
MRDMTKTSTKNEQELDTAIDEVLAANGVEIDDTLPVPVVFDYTDKEVREMIVSSRVRLLIRHPFFGTLATRLILIESEWCPTAATDGRHFYYNANFFRTLTPEEIDFVVGHEVMHCVYEHCGEFGRLMDKKEEDRDMQLWNIAADYKVNQACMESNIGQMPKNAVHDRKFYKSYTEEIYEHLKQTGEADDKETLDVHMFGDGDKKGEGEGNDPSGRNAPIKISPQEAQAIKDQMKQAVIQSAQSTDAGNLPGDVKRIINSMTNPKMDWRELLNISIQSLVKSDYTFMKQSRKSMSMGIYLPGQKNEDKIDVAIGLDVSGSISASMIEEFLGEVYGIMQQFQDFKVRIWTFDTEVYKESYKEFDPYNADELKEYEIIGCGGTDFECNYNFMKENDITPDKFIMFTDGMPWDSWGDESYCDSLFVIHGSESIIPPFGEHAYYSQS